MCDRTFGSWVIAVSVLFVLFVATESAGQMLIDHRCTNTAGVPEQVRDDTVDITCSGTHILV